MGCKHENEASENEVLKDTSKFAQSLDFTNEEVVLLPEANEQVSQWLAYITAQNEINNLRNSTINQVKENASPMAQIMQSLKSSVPDTLSSKAVEARLNVLATKARILQQISSKRNPDAEEIKKVAEEIPTDFNNFKLQLNELFLKTLEDFELELDKAQEELHNSSEIDTLDRSSREIIE